MGRFQKLRNTKSPTLDSLEKNAKRRLVTARSRLAKPRWRTTGWFGLKAFRLKSFMKLRAAGRDSETLQMIYEIIVSLWRGRGRAPHQGKYSAIRAIRKTRVDRCGHHRRSRRWNVQEVVCPFRLRAHTSTRTPTDERARWECWSVWRIPLSG